MTLISQKFKSFWPFTIKIYAFGFIVFMSLLFGLLGWGMQYKLNTISNQALQRNHLAAQEEISYALNHITAEAEYNANTIAGQNPSHSALTSHDIYQDWRNSRVAGSSGFAEAVLAIGLYSAKGKALSNTTNGAMPKSISGRNSDKFFMQQNGRDFLYLFYPVATTGSNPKTSRAYIGFKLDIANALKNSQRYTYVNIDTLKFKLEESEAVPLGKILSRVEFSLVPNTENLALTASIDRFQRQILFVMIVLYLFLYFMLSAVLSAPLRRLSMHIDTLGKGQGGLLAKSYTRSLPVAELEKVRSSLNDYQNKLEKMHLSLNEKNDELWQLAHHDPLTGIYNRRGFEDDWGHVLSVSSGHRFGVALLLFDCDHFKAINDTYGHPTGDEVIRMIAQTLQNTLRHGDRLYRLGGDEFATLFLDIDSDLALQTAERCIDAVSQYDFSGLGIKEPVRLSAGMSYATGTDVELLPNLPKQADIAMYHAKRPGKKKIAVFDSSMSESSSMLYSNSINDLVYKAIENGEAIEMHYQPITNLVSGKVDYYEALVRIRSGDQLILPSTIFPLIEERRLEAEFDTAILGCIAKDLEQGKIPAGTGISFNVSGMGVVDSAVLAKINSLAVFLKQYKLIIEVTETALITQLQLASSILNKLRQTGFLIALDDFGSGYSSLSYLSNMPVDCIKFDITLIRQLLENGKQRGMIEGLAAMVLKAGYTLVAEGVETEIILQKIAQIGFTNGQGFLLGRPENSCKEASKISFYENKK